VGFVADKDVFYHANLTNKMYLLWYNTHVVKNPGMPDEDSGSDQLPIRIYTHVKMNNALSLWPI